MKDRFRVKKSREAYWDWVGDGEEGRAEPAQANPDMLPAPDEEKPDERMLKLRAIKEADLTPHEVLILNLLLTMSQEGVAKHLDCSRGAVTGAVERARKKIERKLATLRLKEALADETDELPGRKE